MTLFKNIISVLILILYTYIHFYTCVSCHLLIKSDDHTQEQQTQDINPLTLWWGDMSRCSVFIHSTAPIHTAFYRKGHKSCLYAEVSHGRTLDPKCIQMISAWSTVPGAWCCQRYWVCESGRTVQHSISAAISHWRHSTTQHLSDTVSTAVINHWKSMATK